jgi:hypothetical protein
MKPLVLTFLLGATTTCFAQKRQVAITIDDLLVASVGDDSSPATAARGEDHA